MGTNYYLHYNRNVTKENVESGLHIGKRSAGWVFHFQAHDNPKIDRVWTYRKLTKTGFIYDEYGIEHSYKDFWEGVEFTKEPFNGEEPYVLDDPNNPEPAWFKRWEDEGYCFSEGDFS